jgi:hypothetical protein
VTIEPVMSVMADDLRQDLLLARRTASDHSAA